MRIFVCSFLLGAAFVYGQSSSPTPNPQDVPQQKPGTNNPDVSKDQHGPAGKPGKTSDTNSADVPVQQPGTDNPDVAKDHTKTSGDTGTSAKSTASRRKARRKSSTTS